MPLIVFGRRLASKFPTCFHHTTINGIRRWLISVISFGNISEIQPFVAYLINRMWNANSTGFTEKDNELPFSSDATPYSQTWRPLFAIKSNEPITKQIITDFLPLVMLQSTSIPFLFVFFASSDVNFFTAVFTQKLWTFESAFPQNLNCRRVF